MTVPNRKSRLSRSWAAARAVLLLAALAGPAIVPGGAAGQSAVAIEAAPAGAAPVRPEARPAAVLPHNLSPWGMFAGADPVVKAVMIGLALASVLTWTIGLAKAMELLAAGRAARRLGGAVAAAPSLREAEEACAGSTSPVARLVEAAAAEEEASASLAVGGLKERVASRLERIEAAAGRRMARGTGLLATIGSTAPFVGLFGTVWGIMNSFVGISRAQTTNLAVVAPGIAEALLATALGLVAAIPAVVLYNVFARSVGGYRAVLADASAAVLRLVSRDADRAARPFMRAAE